MFPHLLIPQPLHWSVQGGRSWSGFAPTIQRLQRLEEQQLQSDPKMTRTKQ